MKIKTSELTGWQLDWAVRCAQNKKPPIDFISNRDNFSTCWNKGGPIIEREKIKVFPNVGGTWSAQIRHEKSHPLCRHPVLDGWTNSSGPTPLIAAMRCYVASKLGGEVEVPV